MSSQVGTDLIKAMVIPNAPTNPAMTLRTRLVEAMVGSRHVAFGAKCLELVYSIDIDCNGGSYAHPVYIQLVKVY